MKLRSLLALCSLIILIPSCCRQKSCCPTTTYCDVQPATPAPYAVTEAAPAEIVPAVPAIVPAPIDEMEAYEALDDIEEPKKDQAAVDKEALDIEEAVEAEAEKIAAEKEALDEKEPLEEEAAVSDEEETDKTAADKESLEDLDLDETSETK